MLVQYYAKVSQNFKYSTYGTVTKVQQPGMYIRMYYWPNRCAIPRKVGAGAIRRSKSTLLMYGKTSREKVPYYVLSTRYRQVSICYSGKGNLHDDALPRSQGVPNVDRHHSHSLDRRAVDLTICQPHLTRAGLDKSTSTGIKLIGKKYITISALDLVSTVSVMGLWPV